MSHVIAAVTCRGHPVKDRPPREARPEKEGMTQSSSRGDAKIGSLDLTFKVYIQYKYIYIYNVFSPQELLQTQRKF